MKNSLFSVVSSLVVGGLIGALALFAYQATLQQTNERALGCEQPKHHCIKVTVDPQTNMIAVDVEPLRKKGPKHKIHWIIDNDTDQAFVFPTNGIEFPGTNEFSCQPNSNPRIFDCDDSAGTPLADPGYKYIVRVKDTHAPPHDPLPLPPNPLDPHVINN